ESILSGANRSDAAAMAGRDADDSVEGGALRPGGRSLRGDVRELVRRSVLLQKTQRTRKGEVSPADRGGMGICMPWREDDAVQLWGGGVGTRRVRVVRQDCQGR